MPVLGWCSDRWMAPVFSVAARRCRPLSRNATSCDSLGWQSEVPGRNGFSKSQRDVMCERTPLGTGVENGSTPAHRRQRNIDTAAPRTGTWRCCSTTDEHRRPRIKAGPSDSASSAVSTPKSTDVTFMEATTCASLRQLDGPDFLDKIVDSGGYKLPASALAAKK